MDPNSVFYDGEKNEITLLPSALATTPVDLSPTQTKLKALIRRRHPEYSNLKAHWEFLEETYEGGRNWFTANIFRYHKEGDEEYAKRVERSYRFNHTREVVDLVNKYLFKKAIVRNLDATETLQDFWKVSTKSNLDVDEFMRSVAKLTSIYGRIAVVIDKPDTGEGAVSVAEAKALNVTPYAYIVPPHQLLDYSFDKNGTLFWALIEETYRDDEDPMNSTGDVRCRYRLWMPDGWALYEEVKDGKKTKVILVDSATTELGVVPVIIVDNTINDDNYESQAMIDDIAYLDRAVANYLSNLDAIIQDQTFSQLAMPAQNVMPGEDSYNKLVEMGTKRIFLYDGEGGHPPAFLSPDPKQAELILAVIHKIINEIYHTVGLSGERTKQDNALGIDNSSGVAKAFDFERVNALLASKASSLEKAENDMADLVNVYNGDDSMDCALVTYPTNFDIRDLYDEFDIAARLALIEAPDTLRREQMSVVVDKLFPQLKKDLKEAIDAELKDWPLDPMEVLKTMTDITAGAKPGMKTTASPGATPAASPKSKQGQNNKPAPK